MIKKIIGLTITLFIGSLTLIAQQQQPLNLITNSYILPQNRITDLDSLNSLQNLLYKLSFGEDNSFQYDEIPENAFFYSIFDKTANPKKVGVLDIECNLNDFRNKNFDAGFKSFVNGYMIDDVNKYSINTIKNNDINAGYIWYRASNTIYMLIYGKSKPGYISASMDVYLTPDKLDAFVTDFITQIKFK
ncbi:hypothetical protein BCY89_03600 [Sphingobacterium siyangense]|uniref:Uncharacterized protein n=1 Tax=Sphingobacterium siyangense TaxID=459529 RepID=A0A420GBK7_9SPHI|nr:hypothetical protein [Sphingobacterium siyangense]QRY60444.1 hypothetical protein JVX97_13755 [Sphingobacterium siyangense]RKF42567.1 hypothetical protein BCY89_03600 [Sphingobacterium siyangense]